MRGVRELERESIRDFVASHTFFGRTLDYGCGQQPYADLVRRTATYIGYDRPELPGSTVLSPVGATDPFTDGAYDSILCTQVVQYVPNVPALLEQFHRHLQPNHGHLVLTGPTCWPEVEPTDLHRFTRAGIARLLVSAGFTVLRLEHRAHVEIQGIRFPLGWGAVAYA